MKNENIIIAMVFLVIVALFAFNFSKITGFTPATITKPTVTISPNTIKLSESTNAIKPGEKINIEIKINEGCVDPKFYIYSFRNNMVGTRKATKVYGPDVGDCARVSSRGAKIPCGSSKYCKGNLKLDTIKTTADTYPDWTGYYILRVFYYDKTEKKFVDTKFKIS